MNIPFYLLFTLVLFLNTNTVQGQQGFGTNNSINCGTDFLVKELFRKDSFVNNLNNRVEAALIHNKRNGLRPSHPLSVTILPVVIHIIHNNGAENISDSRILAGIQHLNEAFANTGYYDNGSGVNSNIRFCLAQRSPGGTGTNGITRDVSTYTNMGGPSYFSDDIAVKDINRWDPKCYINIWLVNNIPGPVAGYAYMPSAHGMNMDGIVMEASYFGASYANDIVTIHEMGHYLGLYHTFEQGCNNNDCSSDGDKVCDTPPDNSTNQTSCGITVNSCSSDDVSGFPMDQNDLTEDYMDYGNWDCMSVFTPGQCDRMNWHILNVRNSLLNCYSCLPPCDAPVTAAFTSSTHIANAGSSISFANTSINGNTFTWYINGVAVSNAFNFSQLFTEAGKYVIRLKAETNNPALCLSSEAVDSVIISCPAQASFIPGYNGISTVGQSITFTNTSSNAPTLEWYYNNIFAGSSNTFTTSFNLPGFNFIKLKASNNYCSDSFTVYHRVNAASDSHFSFKKKYYPTDLQSDRFASTFNLVMPDQSIINIAGNQLSNNLISKFTSTGSPQWTKTYKNNGTAINFVKAISTSDGNMAFLGWSPGGITGPVIVKMDPDGNIIWNKFFSEPASVASTDFIEMPDGSFIISGNYYYGYLILYKITAVGQLSWRKTLAYGDYSYGYHSLQTINNDLYFSCSISNNFGPRNTDGLLLKIDPLNADIIFARRYDIDNMFNWFTKITTVGNKLLIEGTSGPDYTSNYLKKKMLLITDLAGEPENCKLVYYPELGIWKTVDNIFKTADHNILFSLTDSAGLKSHLVKFDASLQFINGRTYLLETQYSSSHHTICEFSNGDLLLGQGDMFDNNVLERILPDLTNLPCESAGFVPLADTVAIIATDITSQLRYSNNSAQTDSVTAISIQNRNIIPTVFCGSAATAPCDTSVCNIYQLQGPTKICHLTDTLKIILNKNANCNLTQKWIVTGTAGYEILSDTDSLINIKLLSPGFVIIKSESTSGCKLVEDSIKVDVTISPSSIDLGPDMQLCEASTIYLNAGTGFKSYLWQNGSADSTFTSYLPGTCFVTATDFCGNHYTDSIDIITIPPAVFDIGPDIEICANDTVSIQAPAGFSDYNWSPNYAISTPYGSTVKLYPLVDTVYSITAVQARGCVVLDSIRIQVHPVNRIELGNDTSFCQGGFVNLNATGDFIAYEWNTGSSNQTITVSTEGLYTVSATDRHGCIAKDTIHILQIYPNPAVTLGNDKNLCENDSIVLSTGGSFLAYLWQDNSSGSTFSVHNPGIYWVEVKDNQNCTGRDSIRILNIVPAPTITLGADTSFCEGQSVILSPGTGFSSYTWQDNSHEQDFTVWQQGQYWVKVTDTNMCETTDTLSVLSLNLRPLLNLGNDTILCNGQSISLNAGPGIMNYVWQDNSTSQFFTADTAGNYWVKATDNKGCSATDSLQITLVVPPANFVKTDYALCFNSENYIKPIGQYNTYFWYDGTVADSVLITSPGSYWLKVTDIYGCETTERFEVMMKDCVNTIYFPNAFSPDGNNINDIFKPTLWGNIEAYHLEIYNRYGEKVFESNNIAKGWNGNFKNVRQGAGTYTWFCRYRLAGKLIRTQKGILVLIR